MVAERADASQPTPAGDGNAAALPPLAVGDASLDQQLADRYSPVVYLRQVSSDICSRDNEGFDPVAVEFALGRDDIPLMMSENGLASGVRQVVTDAPAAADLYDQPPGFYLDYPGTPVRPACVYRRYFADRMATDPSPHVAYAHIYLEPGKDELALQYWMYYYFNDWNNNHEGDWEMITIFFNATTVADALTQEPSRVVYAQHGGGERADWDAERFSKEDGHPVVYVARGAHASFFEQYVYFGLAENGTGFGCETTVGPHRREELQAIVVPHEPSGPDDPFAWLAFDGRWGELRRSEWNGPTGPNDKRSWTQPVTWADAQRDSSLIVPYFDGFGQAPMTVFCGVVSGGSRMLVAFTRTPLLVGGILGLAAIAIALVYAQASATLRGAIAYYRGNLRTIATIGAAIIPLGYIIATLQTLLFTIPPISPLIHMMGRFPGVEIFLLLLLGGIEAAVGVVLISPTVIWAMSQIDGGRRPRVLECYRNGARFIWPILLARLRVSMRILRLVITIVGIPEAVKTFVRAVYIPQAAVAARAGAEGAINESASVTEYNVTRTVLTQVVLLIITLLAGPLIAIFVLLAVPSRPVGLVNYISSLIFAFLYPLGVIGMTLLYRDLRAGEPSRVQEEGQAGVVGAGD